MSNIKSGLCWNSLQQIGQLGFSCLSTIVLSRLLMPEDYGVYGILILFISVSENLSDSGLGGYVIKKRDVTAIYYNTLFVYNMSISILLYGILFFTAPIIANIYGHEIITRAIRVVGLVIIMYAFSITQVSRLLRDLRFKEIAIIQLISGFLAFVFAVIIAYLGYGVWALIFQQIISVGLTTFLYVLIFKNIPKFEFNISVFKESFNFGGFLFAASVCKILTENISNNFIGKSFSLQQTGMFVQASKLQNYPISMTTNVVDRTFFPVLSKINDNDEKLKIESSKLRKQLYSLLFPIFGLLIAYSDYIIKIVLGEKWIESDTYFKILMVASFFMLVKAINRNVLKSVGCTKSIFTVEVCSTLVLLIGLIISIQYKLVSLVAMSLVVTQLLSAGLSIYMMQKSVKDNILNQIKDFLLFIPIAIIPIVSSMINVDNSLLIYDLLPLLMTITTLAIYIILGNTEYCRLKAVIHSMTKRKNS